MDCLQKIGRRVLAGKTNFLCAVGPVLSRPGSAGRSELSVLRKVMKMLPRLVQPILHHFASFYTTLPKLTCQELGPRWVWGAHTKILCAAGPCLSAPASPPRSELPIFRKVMKMEIWVPQKDPFFKITACSSNKTEFHGAPTWTARKKLQAGFWQVKKFSCVR